MQIYKEWRNCCHFFDSINRVLRYTGSEAGIPRFSILNSVNDRGFIGRKTTVKRLRAMHFQY